MDDLDVTPTAPAPVTGLDPLYQQMYGSGTGEEVAERQVGFPVITAFTHYVLRPTKAVRRRSDHNCGARVSVEVIEGIEDSAGHKFTDSGDVAYGFVPSRTKGKPGAQETLSEADFQKKCKTRSALLNRIRQVLGLSLAVPPGSFSDAALDAYAAQFGSARTFIAEVRVEKGNDGVERNRIVWESIAGLDEEEHDSKGAPLGKTALQVAREKIAAWKPKAVTVAGGRSSSSLSNGDLR